MFLLRTSLVSTSWAWTTPTGPALSLNYQWYNLYGLRVLLVNKYMTVRFPVVFHTVYLQTCGYLMMCLLVVFFVCHPYTSFFLFPSLLPLLSFFFLQAANLLAQCKFFETPNYKALENALRDIHRVSECHGRFRITVFSHARAFLSNLFFVMFVCQALFSWKALPINHVLLWNIMLSLFLFGDYINMDTIFVDYIWIS